MLVPQLRMQSLLQTRAMPLSQGWHTGEGSSSSRDPLGSVMDEGRVGDGALVHCRYQLGSGGTHGLDATINKSLHLSHGSGNLHRVTYPSISPCPVVHY